MTSCPEAMGWDSWVFWKKQWVEIWDWTKRVAIRIWARPNQLFAAGCARVCWVSELRADVGRTVNIVKIVSLSLSLCRKPESQEGNKSFVPEKRESSVFRVFRIPMHMNILCMWTFYASVYFTYQYISLIRIMAILQWDKFIYEKKKWVNEFHWYQTS